MQLELEEAAQSLVADPIVSPAPLAAVEARAKAIRARAHRGRVAAIAITSTIVVVVVAVVVQSNRSTSPHVLVRGDTPDNVVSKKCCPGGGGLGLDTLVPTLGPHCLEGERTVVLALTESRLRFAFSCSDVLHNPARVLSQAIAHVANRRHAAQRATAIVAYEQQLGVYGDVVHGISEHPNDVRFDTFSLGVASGTDF